MLSKVPVLPARFRPIAVMSGNGLPLVADANYLYKEVLEANDNLQHMQNQVDDVGDERLALYHSFRAVTGLGDPLHPKLQEKRVKGVLSHIFGGSPKTGAVQRKLISSTVDLVGRAVITPNPDYDMDTVGIPEDKAWEVYKPFLVRRLVRRGMKMVQAMQAVPTGPPMAKNELLGEMDNRPVIINRAPVLHRFGIMAFRPKLVPGAAMQISPLIVKGFNADFDGDAMQFHVPADDEAVKDAYEKMLPSVNLISPADFKSPVHAPSNEYTGGLYVASTRKSKRSTRTFRNWTDALAAFRRGDINIDDEIEVLQ
jgi:DNA-directed RNA polymerase subunit beta'